MCSKEQQSDTSPVYNIELSLVDLSQTLQDDSSAENLPAVLDAILDTLTCSSAETFLSTPPTPETPKSLWRGFFPGPKNKEEDLASKIKKQVVRFLKPPDKYIALTSILLKSQALHRVHSINEKKQAKETSDGTNKEDNMLPVVELPRTEYRKPYIPGKNKPDSFPEVNLYPFSVSHQFPFVGLARLMINSASEQPQNRPLVGFDIVTFDEYNPRLYDSVKSFVEVFQTSFSPWEWKCINTREDVILQEFYLRWSIKEAYTKALGVGMGLPFDSFETRFPGLEGKGIYSWLEDEFAKGGQDPSRSAFFLQGTVVQKPNMPEPKSEKCAFLFCPLWESTSKLCMGSERGWACLCMVHSSLEEDEIPGFELATNWHSLQDLVQWHKEQGTRPTDI